MGKSTICEEFGKNEYESYLLIDFAKKDKEVEMYFTAFTANVKRIVRLEELAME